jgi:hypothetical protein
MAHDPEPLPASAPPERSSAGPAPRGWIEELLDVVAAVRRRRYEEARQAGARWLVECYDIWDFQSGDADGGVYFQSCADESAVDAIVAGVAGDPWNRVAGVYDLGRPLEAQRGGIPPDDWRARRARA